MTSPAPVHVVTSAAGVDQVFLHRADAEAFAAENPGTRVSRHHVRTSMAEAVLVLDRRVVVVRGSVVLDSTHVVHQFGDDPHDTPGPADVEWFSDTTEGIWHIVGFGTDEAELDAEVREAIRRVGQESTAEVVGGAPSP